MESTSPSRLTTSLLDALRSASRDVHQELHVHPAMQALSEGRFTLESYGRLLVAFAAPWSPLMQGLSSFPMGSMQQVLARRFEALQQDLNTLHLPLPVTRDELRTPGALVGIAYAVVGSSMGAQTLSELVAKSLPEAPLAYLGMSPKTAGWPVLASELRSVSPAQWSGAERGTLWAFNQIKAGLDAAIQG